LIAEVRALHDFANVEPLRVEADGAQVRRPELRGRELAGREHARVHARRDLAEHADAGDDLLHAVEVVVDDRRLELELGRERRVLRADPSELVVGRLARHGRVEQVDQRVRDADERGMADHRPHAFLEPVADQLRDHGPVLRGADAPAAELHHDPRRVRIGRVHGGARAERFV
jgi:hypothetical protein